MIAAELRSQLIMSAVLGDALLVTNAILSCHSRAMAAWCIAVGPYALNINPLHPQLILPGGHAREEGGHNRIFLLSKIGLLKP